MTDSSDGDVFAQIDRSIKDREIEKLRGKDISMRVVYDPRKDYDLARWNREDSRLLLDAPLEAGTYELRLQKLQLQEGQKQITGSEIIKQAITCEANLSARVGAHMIEQEIPEEFCNFTLLLPGTVWWRRFVRDDTDVKEHRFAYLRFDQPDDHFDAYWSLHTGTQEGVWDVRYLRLLIAKRVF